MPRSLYLSGLRNEIYIEELERLAANPNYLDVIWEVSPYSSSPMHQKTDAGSRLPSYVTDIIDQPLSRAAIEVFAESLTQPYALKYQFEYELEIDERRIREFASSYLEGNAETKRRPNTYGDRWRNKILARHFVKKRWQKLGVWNPRWGVPADLIRGKRTFPGIGSGSGRATAPSTETRTIGPMCERPSFGAASVAASRYRCLPALILPKALR